MKKTVWIVLVSVVALVAGYIYSKYRIAPAIDFSSIELTDLDGQPVKLADFQNKKLVLNFFETWCGPCVHEMPAMAQTQERLKDENFIFFAISDEPMERLRAFKQHANPGITILHSEQKFQTLKIFTFPTNYVVSSACKTVYKKTGIQNWGSEEMAKKLEDLCK